MKGTALLVLATQCLVSGACAQGGGGFKTAQKLHDDLRITIRVQDSSEVFQNPRPDILTTLETAGYIMGCADAFNSDERYRGLVPKGVSGNELIRVVFRYLDAHPEKWRYDAADEVFFAFEDAYHPKQ